MRTLRRLWEYVFVMVRRVRGGGMAPLAPLRRRPSLLVGVAAFEFGLLFSNRLEPRLKVLAHLRVSGLVGCLYCLDLGSEFARRAGLSDRQLLELHHYDTSDAFDDDERFVLELATALTATPLTLTDAMRKGAAERFSKSQLAELYTSIAWENYVARFNRAFSVPSAGFSSGACAVPVGRADPDQAA